MSLSLKVYHQMPVWSRGIAASLRGYYLNSWRYDSNTEKLVKKTLERDFWSKKEWQSWQEDRLSFVLHRAATRVPFYREYWSKRRRNGDHASWEHLENWPVLEKQTVRENGKSFVADDCRIEKMYQEHTSGTTGASLNLWAAPETVKQLYAIFEARCRSWNGVSRHDRWAILGGQIIAPIRQRKPPFWVWNSAMNQLYMSSYHLSPDFIKFYVDALAKYKIRYVYGYSSALYALADEIIRHNLKTVQLEVAITNAEMLFDYQREKIAAAFRCPVQETYGMAETVAAASECRKGTLHLWPEFGMVEEAQLLHENGVADGDLICTGLLNADMPLIRYRVGDSGTMSNEACNCGRNLPVIENIHGRSDDILYTSDGRRIGRLDPVFKNDLPIREAQIIQTSLRSVVVKFVPDCEFSEKSAVSLTDRVKERMGEVEVVLEKVTEIPRTARGKFRAVICNLSSDEKAIVKAR